MKNFPKYTILLLLAGLASPWLFAQQTPNPTDNIPYELPPVVFSVLYPGLENMTGVTKYNYVRTIVPDVPLQSLPSSGYHFRQSTQYFDGLGRPLQTIAKNAHADRHDIVKAHVYDAAGREPYSFLPYAAPKISILPGSGYFKSNVETQLRGFYEQAGPDEPPYAKTEFDNSPLNRITKQLAPGQAWVGAGKGISYDYRSNTAAEDVRLWSIGNGSPIPVSPGAYSAGELYVTETTDEDGKLSLEYKDKSGRTVLHKRSFDNCLSTPHCGYACTYYVYDDLGRLRFVLPPMAVAGCTVTGNSWALTQTQADGLCYQYTYDHRGRQVAKKIPGKGPEHYVYDKRDRPVLYQDNVLRTQGKWLVTYYDALDRPMMTALCDASQDRAQMAALIEDNTTWSAPHWLYYLKNYDLAAQYPAIITNNVILSHTYYDNYPQFPAGLAFDPSQFRDEYNSNAPFVTAAMPMIVPPVVTGLTRGLVTGSKVRVSDPADGWSEDWLYTALYYDDKGRPIQSQSQNLKAGVETASTIYYFQGLPWKTIARHRNPSALAQPDATDGPMQSIRYITTYDRNIRTDGGNTLVKLETHKINNGIDYPFAYYGYDHLDRNIVKEFPVGVVRQKFNIRGFLEQIDFESSHNSYGNGNTTLFNEQLSYARGFTGKLYNGNISGIVWNGADGKKKAYGYSYDKLDRLSHAEYREDKDVWEKVVHDYTAANISYDLNGNLQTMNQRAPLPGGTPIDMDLLSYTYADHSNRLIKVTDNTADPVPAELPDFKDGADLAEEYLYDANGNMRSDANKGAVISYNYGNKPDRISMADGSTIDYVYDAAGNRLRKTVTDASVGVPEVYDYIGNFVYKDDLLQYTLNGEGRSRPVVMVDNNNPNWPTKFVFDYFIKDHLGNVRSTVTASPLDQQYLALHEIASANVEQLLFDNIPNVRDVNPDGSDPDNQMAAHLVAADPGKRIGTAIMLRTMPGDRFNISAKSYYEGIHSEEAGSVGPGDILSSLLSALMGGGTYGGTPVGELDENAALVNSVLSTADLADQLAVLNITGEDPLAPKAYLNYLFFDDQMQLIPGASGKVQVKATIGGIGGWQTVEPIGNGNVGNTLACANCPPGLLVIYVDNQSIGTDVWFDDLFVGHYVSDVLEESHYYPFGLTVSWNPGNLQVAQPYKYQGIELEKHFGLETYETFYRRLDPQLGRFNSIDPKSEMFHFASPYSSMGNNPVIFNDPLGDANTIYLVNLPNSGINNTEMGGIAKSVNSTFSKLGLEIQATIYKGNNPLDMKNLDKTDGVAIFGEATDVANYANTNLGSNFPETGWGGSENPEKTQGRIIGISSTSLDASGQMHNSDKESMSSFVTLHGAGHVANGSGGHSYDEGSALLWEGGRVMGNMKGGRYSLERSGSGYFEKNPSINNVNDLKAPSLNQNYKNTMQKYFNAPHAKDNYQKRAEYRNNGYPQSLTLEQVFGL